MTIAMRRCVAFLLFVAVAVVGFHFRRSAINMDFQLGNDESEYVGMARDLVRTGQYLQSTSSRAYKHYLPIGYPTLIAAAHVTTGLDFHRSAVVVSMLFGLLVPLLAGAIVYRLTRSIWATTGVSLYCATVWPLIFYSALAMTENPYIVVTMLMAWVIIEMAARPSDRTFFRGCVALGFLFGLAFLIRSGGLYLIAAVPLVLVPLAWIQSLVSGVKPLAKGLAAFVAIGMLFVLMNSYRLSLWNGNFTLTPQLGGNIGVGEIVSKGDLSILKVDETGTAVNLHSRINDQGGAIKSWLADPGQRILTILNNAKVNSRYLWEGLWGNKQQQGHFGLWLVLAALALALAIAFFSSRRHPPLSAQNSARQHLILIAVGVLSALIIMHIGAYSLFMPWRRYIEQVTPFVAICVAIGFYYTASLARERLGRNLSRASGLAFLALGAYVIGWTSTSAQANIEHQRRVAKTRIQSYRGMIVQGEFMKKAAAEAGTEPRIVALAMDVAYYAEGFGYLIPYTEENPEKLSQYLRHHQINFVSTNSSVSIAEGQGGIIGVPLFYLLQTMAKAVPESISEHMPGPFFQITGTQMPRIKRISTVEAPTSNRISLAPGGKYLFLEKVTIQSPEKAAYDSRSGPGSLYLAANSEPVRPIHSAYFRLGVENGNPIWFRYVAVETKDAESELVIDQEALAPVKGRLLKIDVFLLEDEPAH